MNDVNDDRKVGGLEVLTTGLNLAELDLHGGDGFWPEVRRYTADSQLEALVDQCMDGRSAPRLWAFMESPGAGPSAVAAALGSATLLADRGQAVVLLDADEQDPRITRWLGRTEQEGWIDMVRFGASLHAASDPLPSDNRRGSVAGVGSFTPTGVTPDEVADLLGRLRHQADDLVIVVPAKLRSQPWLEEADIRLLCWDLLSRSRNDTETIIGELDRMQVRPDAILGFGVEEYAAIQDRLQEAIVEAPAGPTHPEPEEAVTEPVTEPVGEATAEPELLAAVSAIEPDEREDAAALSDHDEPVAAPARRRTSRVFVWAAAAVTVCVIAAVLFLAGQWRGDDEQPTRVAEAAVSGQPAQRPAAAEQVPASDSDPAELAAGDQTQVAADPPAEIPRREPEGGGPFTPPIDAGATTESTGVEGEDASGATAEPVVEAPVPAAAADLADPVAEGSSDSPEQAAVASEVAFDPSPFQRTPGEAGWTLWLYSLPTEAEATREIGDLERRGLVAESRAVELEARGRWFRVYTGSFASRNEANAAVAGLKAQLGTDWAVPVRF